MDKYQKKAPTNEPFEPLMWQAHEQLCLNVLL